MMKFLIILLFSIGLSVDKNGTTSVTFLEIDVGGTITSMGGAGVSHVNDASASYWNPAGLAFSKKSQLFFMNQSWIAGIQHSYSSVSVPINRVGTLGMSINLMNYGETEVTNLDFQDGTGEFYSALDYSVSFSYARKFALSSRRRKKRFSKNGSRPLGHSERPPECARMSPNTP